MTQIIIRGREARLSVLNGINKAIDFIAPTLGPQGKTVIVPTDFGHQATDDGLTAIRAVNLEEAEAIGAGFGKEIASGMEADLADGRTTGAVVFQKLCQELYKVDYSVPLWEEVIEAKEILIKKLTKEARKVDDLEAIATSASLDPEAGKVIAEAIRTVGIDGQLTVEPNEKPGIKLELVSGMTVPVGYANPYMINDLRKGESVVEEPFILVTNQKIAKQDQILPILQKLEGAGLFRLVIFCDEIEGDALGLACTLMQSRKFQVLAVSTKLMMGDKKSTLEDIAVLTGAKLLTEAVGIGWDKVDISHLGQAQKIVAGKESTLIVDGAGTKEKIDGLIHYLKESRKLAPQTVKDSVDERIANLTGGVGIIRIGIPTANEYRVKKHKVEDAIAATKAAYEEGTVIGGGSVMAKLSTQLPKTDGGQILSKAVIAPLMIMAENVGLDPNDVLSEVRVSSLEHGYDFKARKLVNLRTEGILDSLKVLKGALNKAVSLSQTFSTTEAITFTRKDKE